MLVSQKTFNFVDTTATKKVFALKKRIRAVAGGTSASKTISILIWLIDYCQTKQDRAKLATIVSESYPHLEKGPMLDFENIMRDRGYWVDGRWNQTKHIYTFETGNKLEFLSADRLGKTHGPRRDVLFGNEVNYLEYLIVDQLIIRTREVVWLDWNPSDEFWFYTNMLPNRDDIDFITLTYKDNEALDETTIREIESHKADKAWWTVYGEGKLGQKLENIFHDWKILEELPHEARLIRRGLDFGYTNDPTAQLGIYKYNGGLIFDEEIYLKGLSNKDIADIEKNLTDKNTLIKGDCAEPKSIAELQTYGLNVLACQKGKDSVNHGIQWLQKQKISVTKRSINLIKEYRNYRWEVDRDGKVLNVPRDVFNHLMDAARYGLEDLMLEDQEKEAENYKQAAYQPTEFEGGLQRVGTTHTATMTGGKINFNTEYQQAPITE